MGALQLLFLDENGAQGSETTVEAFKQYVHPTLFYENSTSSNRYSHEVLCSGSSERQQNRQQKRMHTGSGGIIERFGVQVHRIFRQPASTVFEVTLP